MADGRLAVLDFGVTENTPQGWPARLGPLLAAGRDSDAAELHRIAAEAGLLQPARLPPTPSSPLFDPYLDPLRTRPTGSLAAGAGADPAGLRSPERRLPHPAPADHSAAAPAYAAGGHRTGGVLCSLGATVSVCDEVRRWLPGGDGGPGPQV